MFNSHCNTVKTRKVKKISFNIIYLAVPIAVFAAQITPLSAKPLSVERSSYSGPAFMPSRPMASPRVIMAPNIVYQNRFSKNHYNDNNRNFRRNYGHYYPRSFSPIGYYVPQQSAPNVTNITIIPQNKELPAIPSILEIPSVAGIRPSPVGQSVVYSLNDKTDIRGENNNPQRSTQRSRIYTNTGPKIVEVPTTTGSISGSNSSPNSNSVIVTSPGQVEPADLPEQTRTYSGALVIQLQVPVGK